MAEPDEEAAQLAELATGVRDQDDLERDIGRQADQLLSKQADERDQKRLDKTQKDRDRLDAQVRRLEQKLTEFGNHATKQKIRAEVEHYKVQIETADNDLEQIRKRMAERQQNGQEIVEGTTEEENAKRLPGESHREFLIRTGKITPFSKVGGSLLRTSSSLGDVLMDAEEEEENAEIDGTPDDAEMQAAEPRSHRNLLAPGFETDAELAQRLQEEEFASQRPSKRRRLGSRKEQPSEKQTPTQSAGSQDDEESEAEFIPDTTPPPDRTPRKTKVTEDLTGIDDGNESVYKKRLSGWVTRRRAARDDSTVDNGEEEEWHLPHPTRTDTIFEGGLHIPGDIYPALFDYQKTGVQWLWEL